MKAHRRSTSIRPEGRSREGRVPEKSNASQRRGREGEKKEKCPQVENNQSEVKAEDQWL